MVVTLLIFLAVADLALIWAFFRLSRRQDAHQGVMAELTEERSMLTELRASIREDLMQAQGQVRAMKEQVQILATEAEQEVKSGIASITSEVDAIISQLATRFDQPLNDMNKTQHYLENLLQRVQSERRNLARTAERAGALAKFFKDGVRFDDIVKELEDKKFSDIRALVTQGYTPGEIAKELGVNEQEVRFVAGVL